MESVTREAFLRVEFTGYGYGYGDGSGYGSGYGSGDGSGYGSGYGYGYGYGSGDGSGYGYGDGSGDGSGYGSGYGYGDGSGYGDGYGDGYGIKSLNGQPVDMIDGVPTILTRTIGSAAKGFIVRSDLSIVPTFVCKHGDTFAHGETLHKAREALLEKIFDDMTTVEHISAFCAEFKPNKKRPARDFFSWHHRLTGSCEQGRKEFARSHGIDVERDELTPEEFFDLTRDSYGGSIIRQTEEVFKTYAKSH